MADERLLATPAQEGVIVTGFVCLSLLTSVAGGAFAGRREVGHARAHPASADAIRPADAGGPGAEPADEGELIPLV